jgi:putative chitinase
MTHTIDRAFFFDQVRRTLFGGRLSQRQVDGLTAILDRWQAHHRSADDRWLAYILATAHHETGRTMQPVREVGFGKGKPYGARDPVTGQIYAGRGYVQITWKENYRRLGRVLGLDLVNDPDQALELGVAVRILFVGMVDGLFTGRRLAHYFSPTRDDWKGARAIVNGSDRAALIAGYGRAYYAAISYRQQAAA